MGDTSILMGLVVIISYVLLKFISKILSPVGGLDRLPQIR
jgi:hypothetical protein